VKARAYCEGREIKARKERRKEAVESADK